MKLKSFYTTKEIATRLKRQSIEWEKIFASYTSDEELVTRIYRELKRLNFPPKSVIHDPIKIWANELSRAFSKEEVQVVKKHMKKCSTFLANRTNQNHFKNSTLLLLE
jgi:hypothetical protein